MTLSKSRAAMKRQQLRKRRAKRRLDYLELPFTEEEITTALALIWPKADAKAIAAHLARIAPDHVRTRSRRWAYYRKHGEHRHLPLGGWVLPAELFPLLTLISPTAAQRVEHLMVVDWEQRRTAYIGTEQRKAAVRGGLAPTQRQIRAFLKKRLREEGSLPQGVAVHWGPMPPVTDEMIERAERRLQREIERWRRACRRLARYAERRARGEVEPLLPGHVDEISGLESSVGWSSPVDPKDATATAAQQRLLIRSARGRLRQYALRAPESDNELRALAHDAACFRQIWNRRRMPSPIARFVDRFG